MNLSKNFTLAELCASNTAKAKGIRNVPGVPEAVNLTALVHKVLQPLREACGPIVVASGYRCPQLNKAVGGVANSQHTTGEAADLFIHGDKAYGQRLFDWIRTHADFDQLIWEHNVKGTYWVHVSYKSDSNNRRQVIGNLLKK